MPGGTKLTPVSHYFLGSILIKRDTKAQKGIRDKKFYKAMKLTPNLTEKYDTKAQKSIRNKSIIYFNLIFCTFWPFVLMYPSRRLDTKAQKSIRDKRNLILCPF